MRETTVIPFAPVAEETLGKPKARASNVNDFAARWGISRSHVYALSAAGKLKLSKILGKTVVTTEAEEAFAEMVNSGDAA